MKPIYPILALSLIFTSAIFGQSDEIRLQVDGTTALSVSKNPYGYVMFGPDFNGVNLFFGFDSGSKSGQGAVNPNDGKFNIGIGNQALKENTIGISNTAIGNFTLLNNIDGYSNLAVGQSALQSNTTGSLNTAIGNGTLGANVGGHNHTAIGLNALASNINGFSTTAIGYRSAVFDTSATFSVYVGGNAGAGGNSSSDVHKKSNNVMVGYNAGFQSQGSNNVFVGYQAGMNEQGDHKLYVANSDHDNTEALIFGEFDNQYLRFNGSVNIDGLYTLPTTTGSTGQIMKRNALGQLYWANDSDGPWDTTGDDLIYEDGKVGILDDNPQATLAVNGNVRASSSGAETEYVEMYHDGNKGRINMVGDGTLIFGHDLNNYMEIFDGGEVVIPGELGVGTSNPTDALHVVAQGTEDLFRVQLGTSTKMRIYNNGSIALGGNNTNITTGDVYISNQLGVGRTAPLFPIHVGTNGSNGNGAHVTVGGAWTNGSSREFKENFESVDGPYILEVLEQLDILYWNYKDSDEGMHMGPIAEEFYAAFGLGHDAQYISTVDADGVALAAIKALTTKLKEENMQLRSAIEALSQRVAQLEQQ